MTSRNYHVGWCESEFKKIYIVFIHYIKEHVFFFKISSKSLTFLLNIPAHFQEGGLYIYIYIYIYIYMCIYIYSSNDNMFRSSNLVFVNVSESWLNIIVEYIKLIPFSKWNTIYYTHRTHTHHPHTSPHPHPHPTPIPPFRDFMWFSAWRHHI